METIFHKNLSQKIKELPAHLAKDVSQYIDFLLYKSNKKNDSEQEMNSEEFQNWIKNAEQGDNMSLDEFKAKWKKKEEEILNHTN